MSKRWVFLMAAIWVGPAAWAETWRLVDEKTGESSGPFQPSHGAVVSLADRTWVLQVAQTKRDETEALMKRIIIPSIEFRQAAVADVVNFLVEASIAADPEKTGANIVLSKREDLPPPSADPPGSEWDFEQAPPFGMPVDAGRTVTLNLRQISLYDAVQIIAEVADLEWSITEGGVVMVKEKNRAAGPGR